MLAQAWTATHKAAQMRQTESQARRGPIALDDHAQGLHTEAGEQPTAHGTLPWLWCRLLGRLVLSDRSLTADQLLLRLAKHLACPLGLLLLQGPTHQQGQDGRFIGQ